MRRASGSVWSKAEERERKDSIRASGTLQSSCVCSIDWRVPMLCAHARENLHRKMKKEAWIADARDVVRRATMHAPVLNMMKGSRGGPVARKGTGNLALMVHVVYTLHEDPVVQQAMGEVKPSIMEQVQGKHHCHNAHHSPWSPHGRRERLVCQDAMPCLVKNLREC